MEQFSIRRIIGMGISIKHKSGWLAACMLMLLPGLLYSRPSPEDEYNHYASLYPNASTVYIQRKQEVNYALVNDSVVTTVKVYEEIMHLDQNAMQYAGKSVFSFGMSEVYDLKAYTLVPGKRKYEKVEVQDFKESFDQDAHVFFDDSKEIKFTFPSVQRGAKTILEYTRTISDPRMISMFFFNTYIPVHQSEYVVTCDANMTVRPQFFNSDGIDIAQNKKVLENGRLQYVFEADDIQKLTYESQMPSYQYLSAAVYCPLSSYQVNGKTVDLISTPQVLHTWYRSFIKDLLPKDPELTQFVNTLVDKEDDTLEKVRKIFYWVQSNIQYIAFEDGMRGFIPHPGMKVVNHRYGDCKDMASAIVCMLRALDIDAHYTWIGSRDLPYSYHEVPAPITDNHMIATLNYNDTTYFLDATGQYSRIDLPTSMIQGKECLISLSDSTFEIKKVPEIPKEDNIMSDSVIITMKDNTLHGNGFVNLSGYAKVFNSYKLVKSNPKSTEDYLKRLLTKGSNKFHLGEYDIQHLDDRDTPIAIDYDFYIPDYFRQIGNDIYINPVLDRTMTDGLLKDRKNPLENDYKYINNNVVTLEIPEGYEPTTIPDDVSAHNDLFGYEIKYEQSGSYLIVHKKFFVNYLLMYPKDFDSWNQIISDYASACRNAIILSKKNTENE